jgi:putative ABC transport system permease protein
MGLANDLRHALRAVRTDWRFSLTLVATLATGIAASGVIFNVLNASMLRPLPIPQEERVYRLQDYTLDAGGQRSLRSNRIPNFLAIKDEARSFAGVIGMRTAERSMIDGATPVPLRLALVSAGALPFLGVRPHTGRLFTDAEDRAGVDASVLVLSFAFWQRHFGGSAAAIGRTVRLEDRVVTIIGVAPPGFHFPYRAEAWMPENADPDAEYSVAAFARLAPESSRRQAEVELEAISTRAEAIRPVANRGLRFAMTPIRESLVGDQAQTSMALMGAAVLLLLLASANVANLLLARGIRRSKEIAVRAALGAGRWRQVRQMLVESLTYAALGTAVGLALAAPLSALVLDLVPRVLRDELGLAETSVDWRAALFAAALTATAGVLAGVAPALKLARTDVSDTLRQQTRGATGGHRLMRGLVIGEVALAAVLLLSAGLMIDNLQRLLAADLGLRSERLLSMRLALPERYDTAERRITLARQLQELAAALPGVERAGLVSMNPLERGSFGAAIESEDAPLAPGQSGSIVNHRLVSDGWLQAAGVTLIQGRGIESIDTAGGLPVAVVSRRLADRLWPGADAVGKRLRQVRPDAPWLTVVGIAADVRDSGDWRDTWYVPYEQHAGTLAGGTIHVMVRSAVGPDEMLPAIREAVARIDPLLPVPEPSIMTTLWSEAQSQQRMGAVAATLFAVSGLLLAALGTYGVLAYLVSSRAREFGIRQALGATPRQVTGMVLRDGGTLVVLGLLAGGGLGLLAVRAFESVIAAGSGVPALLPVMVAAALTLAAAAASLTAARRATRVSPVDVMRSE